MKKSKGDTGSGAAQASPTEQEPVSGEAPSTVQAPEAVDKAATVDEDAAQDEASTTPETSSPERKEGQEKEEDEVDEVENKGQLIIDATCAPADIAWPTDLNLLNNAREKTEKVIDELHAHAPKGMKKPRTYRQKARREYLTMAKNRKKSANVLRRSIGKQLGYLERNLRTIDALLKLVPLAVLDRRLYRDLLVSAELLRQQKEMHQAKSKRVQDRIVSIAQPHVRPIVRGKASAKVEFGMKLSMSVVMGWCTLDRTSWNAYNEGGDLQTAVKQYRKTYGCYPDVLPLHATTFGRVSDDASKILAG